MAEARETGTRSRRDMSAVKTTELSFQLERFPRDLLHGFVPATTESHRQPKTEKFVGFGYSDEIGEEEIELNLGLSLGGKFGIDKSPGGLKRSSSIVGTTPILRLADESAAATVDPYTATGLKRTTSLPVEMEEEWRKRKEIQTLRRMEAKRRRCEKQKDGSKIGNGNRKSYGLNVNLEEDVCSRTTASFGLNSWVSAAEKSGFLLKLPVPRQGSTDSDGGGGSSSGMSELENKPSHDKSLRRNNSVDKRGKETTAAVEDMPCVFTKGLGPNGRRVEGILYKYGKGEEVRIMCVCHGTFLSPAEFVKHAGGGDVDHPLRHIVVDTSSSASSFL